VFEEFAQEAPDTSARFGGTGLGLPIARRLAEAMGGTLTLASEPGRGTVASLDLPLTPTDAPAPAAHPSRAWASEGQPRRVLVAEDHRTNQIILGGMLARLGHRFDVVDDGDEVLEAITTAEAAGHPYDLVLRDPMTTGLERGPLL